MKKDSLISVIVPVYNVDAYLDRCISSITGQTYENLEIILVDDGSGDRSGEICDDWAAKDSRIRVIHQKNSGVSAARNAGLDCAAGDYIAFVDADDFLPEDALGNLARTIGNCQLAMGGMCRVDTEGQLLEESSRLPRGRISASDFLQELFREEKYTYLGYLCDKLFVREFIEKEGLRFDPEIKLNEDRLFLTRYLLQCREVGICDADVYYYRYRDESAMGSQKRGYCAASETELMAFEKMKEHLQGAYPDISVLISRRICEKSLYWLRNIPRDRREERQTVRKYLHRNGKIWFWDKDTGAITRLKIVGHCLLER